MYETFNWHCFSILLREALSYVRCIQIFAIYGPHENNFYNYFIFRTIVVDWNTADMNEE